MKIVHLLKTDFYLFWIFNPVFKSLKKKSKENKEYYDECLAYVNT